MGSQKGVLLNVGDIKKYSTELTYNDLMLLYKEYYQEDDYETE